MMGKSIASQIILPSHHSAAPEPAIAQSTKPRHNNLGDHECLFHMQDSEGRLTLIHSRASSRH
jgi:hypothetical protein